MGGDRWLHFVGVGGSGMSALAQFHALEAAGRGGLTTGSDRAFDNGERADIRRRLEEAGVRIVPQDGSFPGAAPGRRCDAVIVSTAVEASVSDHRVAGELGLPLLHRSELLARHVADHRTIAVSGTSGKSTVTAMVWTILDACGLAPGVLTGGPLAALSGRGLLGNAHPAGPVPDGGAPWLVIEADESDGSLVRYAPHLGVILNLGLDHKPCDEVLEMFRVFAGRSDHLVVQAARNLQEVRPGAVTFGAEGAVDGPCDFPATDIDLLPRSVAFTLAGARFAVPQPGLHTVLNAAAAVAACATAGVDPSDMVAPLATFAGVARRFQSLGSAHGVEVIDDFAHNPDKLAAALAAGRQRLGVTGDPAGGRLLAVFQPHGFGPTRFLRRALVEALATGLRRRDVLWLPEIYFAGGTVVRDISSADLAADLTAAGRDARFVAARKELPALVAAEAEPGDLVLVMGARDPSLTDLGRQILAAISAA